MRELSIFCDESGDFGALSQHSPTYLLSLVLHDQSADISGQIGRFTSEVRTRRLEHLLPVHTAPLIRREEAYSLLEGEDRRRLFDALFAFFRRCDVRVAVIEVDKRRFGSGHDLEERISRQLGQLVRDNLELFHSYDRVVVYYDRGQKEISRLLRNVFGALITGVEFRIVAPADYMLFQVADLACTMQLVESRRKSEGMTKSESAFFGGAASFKKTYYRAFASKLLV